MEIKLNDEDRLRLITSIADTITRLVPTRINQETAQHIPEAISEFRFATKYKSAEEFVRSYEQAQDGKYNKHGVPRACSTLQAMKYYEVMFDCIEKQILGYLPWESGKSLDEIELDGTGPQEIDRRIPGELDADLKENLYKKGRVLKNWIESSEIKFPTTLGFSYIPSQAMPQNHFFEDIFSVEAQRSSNWRGNVLTIKLDPNQLKLLSSERLSELFTRAGRGGLESVEDFRLSTFKEDDEGRIVVNKYYPDYMTKPKT